MKRSNKRLVPTHTGDAPVFAAQPQRSAGQVPCCNLTEQERNGYARHS